MQRLASPRFQPWELSRSSTWYKYIRDSFPQRSRPGSFQKNGWQRQGRCCFTIVNFILRSVKCEIVWMRLRSELWNSDIVMASDARRP